MLHLLLKRYGFFQSLTDKHSAKSLKERDPQGERQASLAGDVEPEHHDEQHQANLNSEERELSCGVSEQDLRGLHT